MFSYPKENRLRTQRDFDFKGCSRSVARTPFFTILCKKTNVNNVRIGVVLSRKVGNSVVRHRLKRVSVESFRTALSLEERASLQQDYLIVFNGQYFRKNRDIIDFRVVEQEIRLLLPTLLVSN